MLLNSVGGVACDNALSKIFVKNGKAFIKLHHANQMRRIQRSRQKRLHLHLSQRPNEAGQDMHKGEQTVIRTFIQCSACTLTRRNHHES